MPLRKGWELQDDATRTAALALRAARERVIEAPGMTRNLYERLSGMICWDAVMMCAWFSHAIDLAPPPGLSDIENGVYHYKTRSFNLVTTFAYDNLFPRPVAADSAGAALSMPLGSFIGFLTPQNGLQHVMLYVGDGLAAGTNNGCIFDPIRTGGWDVLDLLYFFRSDHFRSGRTRMIYQSISGQTIHRT
jgi:hypothetical protein